MAEQIVSWKAVADFARVRKEAERTERSLESLENQEKSLGQTLTETTRTSDVAARKQEQSNSRLGAAIEAVARRRKAAAEVERKAAETSSRATERATEKVQRLAQAEEQLTSRAEYRARRQEQAQGRVIGVIDRLAKAYDRLSNRSRSTAQAEAERERATAAVGRATLSNERAQLRLAAATARYERIAADTTRTEHQRALALNAMQRAQNEAASAADRMSASMERARGAQAAYVSGGGGGGGKFFRGMREGWRQAGDAASAFNGILLLKFPAAMAILTQLVAIVGALGGAFMALSGAIGPAIGALASLPQMLLGIGTAAGTAIAAFRGVGEALKAYGKQQEDAGKAAETAAKQQENAAQRVADAQTALMKAERTAARSARDNARAVANARRSAAEQAEADARSVAEAQQNIAQVEQRNARALADAQADAARTAQRNALAIARAREDAARANERAADRVEASEESLANAQRNARAAQLGLNDARRTAVQQLEDMRNAVRDTALSEESAVLAVEEARQRLFEVQNSAGSTDLDIRRADLALREAQARLDDAREARHEAVMENDEAQRKGIEGSEVVEEAHRRIADSNDVVRESEEDLAEARRDAVETARESSQAISEARQQAARDEVESQQRIRDVQRQAVQDTQDAQRRLSDALRDQARSARDSQEAIALALERQREAASDNAESIAEAQAAVVEAMAAQQEAFNQTSASADAFKQAMDNLSPSARRLVWLLISLQDEFKELRTIAAEAMLPGVIDGLKALTAYFPLLRRTVHNTGVILGNFFRDFGNMMTTDENMGIMERLFGSNERILALMTGAILDLSQALLRVMDAARPLTEWLARSIALWAESREEATRGAEAANRMEGFFSRTRRTLSLLAGILGGVMGGLSNVAGAGQDFGYRMLTAIRDVAQEWEAWTGSVEGQASLKAWFEDIEPAVMEVGRLIRYLFSVFASAAASDELAPFLERLRTDILPGLGELFSKFSEDLSGPLMDTLSAFIDMLNQMADAGLFQGLETFLDILSRLFGVLGDLVAIPGVGPFLGGLAAFFATIKAIKFAGAILGITSFMNGLKALWTQVDRGPKKAGILKRTFQRMGIVGGGAAAAGGTAVIAGAGGDEKRGRHRTKGGGGARRMASPKAAGGGAAMGVGLLLSLIPAEGALGAILTIVGTLLMFLPLLIPVFAALGGVIAAISAPIWITIGVIAALVTGITLLWKHNEGFRRFVQRAWEVIKNAISVAWNRGILPALRGFKNFITDTLWPAIQRFYSRVIRPIFRAIGDAVMWTWRNLIRPALNQMSIFINGFLVPVIKALWNYVVKPIFRRIGDHVKGVWNSLIKPIFKAWRAYINGFLIPIIKLLWDRVIKPIFSRIGGHIKDVWRNTVRPIFSSFRGGIDKLVDAFRTAKSSISRIWSGITDAITGPLRSVISFINQNFIGKLNNWLSKIPGVTLRIKEIPMPRASRGSGGGGGSSSGYQRLASGGRVQGWSPNDEADNIPAMLTADEYVVRRRSARKLQRKNPGLLDYINRTGTVPGFADGGSVGEDHTESFSDKTISFIRNGFGAIRNGASKAKDVISDPIASLKAMVPDWLSGIGNSVWAQAAKGALGSIPEGLGKWAGDKLSLAGVGSWIKGKWQSFTDAVSGGGTYGGPNAGWQKIVGLVRAAGFEPYITSTVRAAGGRTLTGRTSRHGLGLAVDMAPNKGIQDFLWSIRNSFRELYLPDGRGWLMGKSRYAYPGADITMANHMGRNAHIHAAYAEGGKVAGDGTGDRVPAMLEPGEFVVRKRAVAQVGLAQLRALNNGGRGRTRNGVQYFHEGGPVRTNATYKQGRSYPWINYVKMLYGMRPSMRDQLGGWGVTLSRRVRASNQGFPGSMRGGDASNRLIRQIRNYIGNGRRGFGEIANRFRGQIPNVMKLEAIFRRHMSSIFKGITGAKKDSVMTGYRRIQRRLSEMVGFAQRAVGMSRDGQWSKTLNQGLMHLMKHGASRPVAHDDFAVRPWKKFTATETAARQQRASNTLQREYNGLLDKIARWGNPLVVDKLLEMGPVDGIKLARDAASSRARASLWEKELQAARDLESVSDADSTKMVALIHAGTGQTTGIRSLARELGVPDYSVVQTYERLLKVGRLRPHSRTRRLDREVRLFRQGLFYAAGGGRVPGSGSGDTVPAMLEPGEFVLRKSAVQALGLKTVEDLNSVQGFAEGGLVMSPSVPSVPAVNTSSDGMRALADRVLSASRDVNVNINTTINNPVAEPSTLSLHKMLRRKAATGELNLGTGRRTNIRETP